MTTGSTAILSHPSASASHPRPAAIPHSAPAGKLVSLVLRQRLERRDFKRQLEDLITTCLHAGVEEVLLYPHGVGAADSDTGFWTEEELKHDLLLLEIARERLEESGLRMGINIWQTIGHSDRGRKMRGEFAFQPLISDAGDPTDSQACPLCPAWREYYFHCLRGYAGIKPSRFYFDDDFRYQNHGNSSGTGAAHCFCPLHLQDFNVRHGTSYDRESLIRDIVRPGAPHPVREQWLASLNEQLIELAAEFERVIHEVSPETEIGLMSSGADQMRAEGRDWARILRAAAGKGKPLLYRPCYPDYVEFAPREHTNALAFYRQIFAELPRDVVPFAEIDNCLPSEFNQSPVHVSLRMLLAALCGTRGFHLSLFDVNGNADTFTGSSEYARILPRFHESLRPLLGKLSGPIVSHGLQLPQNSLRVLRKETQAGKNMSEIAVDSLRWAKPLQLAGLPISFEPSWAAALTEDALWGLEREDVCKLLQGAALLDYTALRWMAQHGYSDLVGLKAIEELPSQVQQAIAEEVVEESDPYLGARFEHKPLHAVSPECRFVLDPAAVPVTRLVGRMGSDFGPGAFRFTNALGGTIFGMPLFPQALEYNPFQTRYRLTGLRQQLLRQAEARNAPFFHIEGQPNVLPLHLQYGARHLLACVNLRSQSAEALQFRCHAIPTQMRGFLWNEARCHPLEFEIESGESPAQHTVRIITRIPPSAVCILITD